MSIETAILTEDSEDTMQDLYIIFNLDEREYGIEIRYLIEIIAFQPITEIDKLPPYVKGVINLRGKIIPVIDVRLRFGLESRDYNEFTCILIVNHNKMIVGLIVDGVREVLKIAKENIEDAPKFDSLEEDRFIQSIGKSGEKLKMLLNLEKLLIERDIAQLQEKKILGIQ